MPTFPFLLYCYCPKKILYTFNCKLPKSSCKLPKFSLSARSHNGICMKEIILGGSNWRKKSPCIGATVSASVSFLLRVLFPMVTVFINLGERIILMSPSCYWALQSVLPRLFSSWLLTRCWAMGRNLSNLVAVAWIFSKFFSTLLQGSHTGWLFKLEPPSKSFFWVPKKTQFFSELEKKQSFFGDSRGAPVKKVILYVVK